MSGFTTYNSSGGGTPGGVSGASAAFSYDPLYTSSVPTQNIPGGESDTGYLPGSFLFNGTSDAISITNPSAPNSTYNYPVTTQGTAGKIPLLNGSGDFTVECWINNTAVSGANARPLIYGGDGTISNSWCLSLPDGSGTIGWWYNGAFRVTSTSVIALNTWNHVAYVRSGTTGTLYLNGVSAGSWTDSTNYASNTTYNFINMGRWGTTLYYTGYISQPRITLSALYTSTFVPSPVLGIGTSVLYLPAPSSGSVANDFSPSGSVATALAGSVTYNVFAPANAPVSGIFLSDTTSNISTAPTTAFNFGTGGFICEYWINMDYTSSLAQNLSYFNGTTYNLADVIYVPGGTGWGLYNFGAGDLTKTASMVCSPNAWNHIAYGKSGGNLTLWVNGQQVATVASSANVGGGTPTWSFNRAGNPAKLSLGPIRISNSAVYTTGTNFSPPTTFVKTANTVFLLQGGNSLSSALTDQSVNAITVSAYGNVVSGSQNVNYGVSANVIGDTSGAQNTGLTLRASGTGNTLGESFYNNYGGYWNFNGVTSNTVINPSNTITSSNAFTYSTWFQTSTSGASNGILASLDAGFPPNQTGKAGTLYINTSTNALMFKLFTGAAFNVTSATGNVADGKWHHAAVTYTPASSGNLSLYVDGQYQRSGLGFGGISSIAGYFRTGGTLDTAGWSGDGLPSVRNFTGNIGPTAVYASTLTPTQVSQIYSTQVQRFGNATIGNTTANFSYTGNVQTFTVPYGVTQVNATVIGAAGAGSGQNGGFGANIIANLSVTPGQTLYMIIGKGGTTPGDAAPVAGTLAQGGGGGAGRAFGGGGGGFSGIFNNNPVSAANATVAQSYAMLIAGGGGGATNYISTSPTGGNAAISLTGNSTSGYAVVGTSWWFPNGWSSTGTQIVANVSRVVNSFVAGGNLPTGYGNIFSTGMPLQLTGVGNVLSGQYVTVASVSGNALYLANGNVVSFPTSGTTAGNTQFQTFNYVNPWATQYPGSAGGPASITTPGAGGLQSSGMNLVGGTITKAESGSALAGGNGGSGAYGGGGGGGGGGGYWGGGGGSAGPGDNGSGGGGANYVSPTIFNGVTYGTVNAGTTGSGANGNIRLSWTNSANFTYTTGTVQTFTVPPYVTRVTARVVGAAGGMGWNAAYNAYSGNGGAGANISSTIFVTPGQTLYLVAGQGGNSTSVLTANIAAGNISQGGGGGVYAASAVGNVGGQAGAGGGFSGIFTSNPATAANAQVAAQSAVVIAGGGAGGEAFWNTTPFPCPGGNAASTINGQGGAGTPVILGATSVNQQFINAVSNGSTITVNLNQSAITGYPSFYSVGQYVSLGGASNYPNTVPLLVTAVGASTITLGNSSVPVASAATYTAGNIINGGYNGSAFAAFNTSGGGGYPWAGGYGAVSLEPGNLIANPTGIYATSGSQLQGGNGASKGTNAVYVANHTQGSGGGGGYYGGGGGSSAASFAASGGGGSNYANAQIVTNLAYGTQTVNTTGGSQLHGYITLSW